MATFKAIESETPIGRQELSSIVIEALRESGRDLSNIAVVSTDKTRKPGKAGEITEDIYKQIGIGEVFIALGSHTMHTPEENVDMFGNMPYNLFNGHDWKEGVVRLGTVPENIVRDFAGGKECKWAIDIPVQLNKKFYQGLKNKTYSTAVSIGPVFPHEVVGFSNGLKNLLVGLGGKEFVDASHFLGASYGMEKMMGRLNTPVRKVFNYANEKYVLDLGVIYVLTVLDKQQNVRGIYIGDDIETHAQAADLSKRLNVDVVNAPLDHVVVYLDPSEFTSFWLCNKAIYRTRMGMSDNGELIAIAPGLRSYADDPKANPKMDELIAKHGYWSTEKVLDGLENDPELAANLSVAAHLIHGSPEGRFNVTFATDNMSKHDIEKVGFKHVTMHEIEQRYDLKKLKPGINNIGREKIYYIPDPSSVLLSTKDKMTK